MVPFEIKVGCCRNFWGDFGGNAFRDGLLASLSHEKMSYAREMLEGKKPARPDIPCTTCELYTRREHVKQWFKVPPALDTSERTIALLRTRAQAAANEGDLTKAATIARVLLQLRPDDAGGLSLLERERRPSGSRFLLSRQGRRDRESPRHSGDREGDLIQKSGLSACGIGSSP